MPIDNLSQSVASGGVYVNTTSEQDPIIVDIIEPEGLQNENFEVAITTSVGVSNMSADIIYLIGAPADTTKVLTATDAQNYTLAVMTPATWKGYIEVLIDSDDLVRA